MDLIRAVKIYFPVSAEGDEENSVYTPNQDGRWPVVDERGDEVCTCRAFEIAQAVADCLNEWGQGSESVVVEIGD